MFNNIYKNKKVLITGHTGFKGSWLSLWLELMGAKVIGYSINVPTMPSLFELIKPKSVDIRADINDLKKLKFIIKKYKPEIIFHLAAQSLVGVSYKETINTLNTNIIGTANILESLKENKFVKAVVVITTDKVYLNNEANKHFKETDCLGGYDPYSASKAACEIIVSSYRNSFFNIRDYGKTHKTLIATARAGNSIGGGDFAKDRLVSDFTKAILTNTKLTIRNPESIRPWQYILDTLRGYLLLGARLLEGKKQFAQAWNFGPKNTDIRKVEDVIKELYKHFERFEYCTDKTKTFHETKCLKLDISKTKKELKWIPKYNMVKTLNEISNWIKTYQQKKDIRKLCVKQIKEFCNTKN
ncbi:MAG: CDP-glucose 4,6-dehydratase [Elusimicrobia bacterium]|nr:CDP-glucose 4,6-dehydratase [Elusimicrobiota bacterium]